MGAQVCAESGDRFGPCQCAGADGGELDAGDLDSGIDAGRVDAGRDAGLQRDAGTDARVAECDLVTQTGCEAGQGCYHLRWVTQPGGGERIEDVGPYCAAAGTLPEHWVPDGRVCLPSAENRDQCEPGTFCRPAGVLSCYRYCDPGGTPCPQIWSFEQAQYLEQACCRPFGGIDSRWYCDFPHLCVP